jgi:hypothetical protein
MEMVKGSEEMYKALTASVVALNYSFPRTKFSEAVTVVKLLQKEYISSGHLTHG